ncbi:hypothetical protein HBI56_033530 [Parastagonospora nodorum]|uniref:Uncharacterized protein n=1 Tax=Phaeosphaeria nodorum (strain SN15 / ATCC MYA-4574 / FGSC 10173) TaxID=321614 RepID=A0A7U2EZ24_PHANO|nr:hypothetical protein HBH56_021320 [Parastagonospora nodorum]QRC95496.1 hypothetical protein JI435_407440 [Parastagonospora nodorum SN15]KAH3937486.1 hypothetical protein HBH54_013170 [Parastagonospora nodorum]KAH3944154.1 hypothetical protein HBH53_163580 [Parastagonospora nodorum]KAH3967667.1 hypothetical protein HBH51_136900 [Parastagonospora nodorum]
MSGNPKLFQCGFLQGRKRLGTRRAGRGTDTGVPSKAAGRTPPSNTTTRHESATTARTRRGPSLTSE